MFLEWAIAAILIASIVFGCSTIIAKNRWKRLLAISLISAKIIMVIVLYALLTDTAFFLDVAIIYTILSYIGIIVLANYMLEWRKRQKK